MLDLSQLKSFTSPTASFYQTKSLSITSMISYRLSLIDLPLVETISLENQSFYELTNFTLNRLSFCIWWILDLPKLKEIRFGQDCLNKFQGDLILCNYPNLEKIIIKKNSLKNVNLLKIGNLEKLNTIEIESDNWNCDPFNNQNRNQGCFGFSYNSNQQYNQQTQQIVNVTLGNVKQVIIESIVNVIWFDEQDLPCIESLEFNYIFVTTTDFSLSSIITFPVIICISSQSSIISSS